MPDACTNLRPHTHQTIARLCELQHGRRLSAGVDYASDATDNVIQLLHLVPVTVPQAAHFLVSPRWSHSAGHTLLVTPHWSHLAGHTLQVAIKQLERAHLVLRYVESELVNHSQLRHPHVVQFREVFLTDQHVSQGAGSERDI